MRCMDNLCDLWCEGIQKGMRFSFSCEIYAVVGVSEVVVVLARGEGSTERGDAVSVGSVTISSLDNNCSMDLLIFYDDDGPDTDMEGDVEGEGTSNISHNRQRSHTSRWDVPPCDSMDALRAEVRRDLELMNANLVNVHSKVAILSIPHLKILAGAIILWIVGMEKKGKG